MAVNSRNAGGTGSVIGNRAPRAPSHAHTRLLRPPCPSSPGAPPPPSSCAGRSPLLCATNRRCQSTIQPFPTFPGSVHPQKDGTTCSFAATLVTQCVAQSTSISPITDRYLRCTSTKSSTQCGAQISLQSSRISPFVGSDTLFLPLYPLASSSRLHSSQICLPSADSIRLPDWSLSLGD